MRPPVGSDSNDNLYGQLLKAMRDADILKIERAVRHYPPRSEDRTYSALHYSTRWILKELRNFNREATFGSVAPFNDDIYNLLASIEGPKGTPYEGGVFWIKVDIPDSCPWTPPKMRFLTKVYHPNIDTRGNICVDFLVQKSDGGAWSPVFTQSLLHWYVFARCWGPWSGGSIGSGDRTEASRRLRRLQIRCQEVDQGVCYRQETEPFNAWRVRRGFVDLLRRA